MICFFLFRHRGNGAVIARSSQPEVGWLGWRSAEDEELLKALANACALDTGDASSTDEPANGSDSGESADVVASNNAKVRGATIIDFASNKNEIKKKK